MKNFKLRDDSFTNIDEKERFLNIIDRTSKIEFAYPNEIKEWKLEDFYNASQKDREAGNPYLYHKPRPSYETLEFFEYGNSVSEAFDKEAAPVLYMVNGTFVPGANIADDGKDKYIPFRRTLELLGYSVNWDKGKMELSIANGEKGTNIRGILNNNKIHLIKGKETVEAPLITIYGRLYVPAYVMSILNGKVGCAEVQGLDYDGSYSRVVISKPYAEKTDESSSETLKPASQGLSNKISTEKVIYSVLTIEDNPPNDRTLSPAEAEKEVKLKYPALEKVKYAGLFGGYYMLEAGEATQLLYDVYNGKLYTFSGVGITAYIAPGNP